MVQMLNKKNPFDIATDYIFIIQVYIQKFYNEIRGTM